MSKPVMVFRSEMYQMLGDVYAPFIFLYVRTHPEADDQQVIAACKEHGLTDEQVIKKRIGFFQTKYASDTPTEPLASVEESTAYMGRESNEAEMNRLNAYRAAKKHAADNNLPFFEDEVWYMDGAPEALGGYVTIHPEIFDVQMLFHRKDALTFRVYLFMLLKALSVDPDDKKAKPYILGVDHVRSYQDLKKGEMCWSNRHIAEALKVKYQYVQRSIKDLELCNLASGRKAKGTKGRIYKMRFVTGSNLLV